MSSFEYLDRFKKSQSTGIYQMFVFDLKNSKKLDKGELSVAEDLLKKTVLDVYNVLESLEAKTGKKILLDKSLYENEKWMPLEPFFFADAACISIYRDSISENDFLSIFNEVSKNNNFIYDCHITNGYYETTYWSEGNEKFARSYCFDILSNIHKNKTDCDRLLHQNR